MATYNQLKRTTTSQPDSATSASSGGSSANSGFQYGDYQESAAVQQAEAMLNQHVANKPGEYQSQWQTQLDETLNQILNREKFSYDLNGDALYQQYKDQYITQGRQAMMDTMGQAAALTGGYGNSYAQTAGQQTYQGYLQQLNEVVPELYQLALDQYNREGDEMYNRYGLFADREDQDYGRYRDSMADWQSDRDYYTDRYDSERDYDYGKYVDNRDFSYGQYVDERNFNYQKETDDRNFQYQQSRDQKTDQQTAYTNMVALITTTGYVPTEAELQAAGMTADEAVAWKTYYDSQNGGGTSGGSSSMGGNDNAVTSYSAPDGWSTDDVENFQREAGITVDGIWGPETQAAYDSTGGGISASALVNMQYSLGVEPTGVWDEATAKASGYNSAAEAYAAWNKGLIGESVNSQILAANKAVADFRVMPKTAFNTANGTYEDYVEAQIEKYVQNLAKTDERVAEEVGAALLIKYNLA